MNSEAVKEYLAFSVSHTTRQPRKGEQEGKDYHFVSRDNFNRVSHLKVLSTCEYLSSHRLIGRLILDRNRCSISFYSERVRELLRGACRVFRQPVRHLQRVHTKMSIIRQTLRLRYRFSRSEKSEKDGSQSVLRLYSSAFLGGIGGTQALFVRFYC